MIMKRRTTTIRFVWLALVLAFYLIAAALPAGAQEGATRQVHRLEITGPVTPAMITYFEREIQQAESEAAEALVIQLNTPGGQVDLMLRIVQDFRAAQVPVIVYVAPSGAQAASAGAVITMAAHAAAMAPETVIGAASPVGSSGEELGETAARKTIEDLKATVRGLTERRGEEATLLAEAMIEEARAVNAVEALESGLIDAVAADLPALLSQLDGLTVRVTGVERTLQTASAEVVDRPLNFLERVLHTVVNPTIVTFLLAIAVPAILIELSSPGGWVAGFVGVVSLGLGIYGLGVLPVNWLGLGFVAVAFVLLALDIKAPSHGALTAAGIGSLIAGFLILFNYPGSPEFAQVSIPAVVLIAVLTGGFFAFVVAKALTIQRRKPVTGLEGLMGAIGEVRTPLSPTGSVFLQGERWRAETADGSTIAGGARVEVAGVRGFTLIVRPVDTDH
jgi:membrane-bound serine protease (ClpP class)